MSSDLRIDVDFTNPGQYFACCGALELVSRMEGDAQAWFGDEVFHLSARNGGTSAFERALTALRHDSNLRVEPAAGEDAEDPIARLEVQAPFALRLDWWIEPDGSSTRLKTWAGQMRVAAIFRDLRAAWSEAASRDDARSVMNRTRPLTGRFGFDPRSSWTPLDVGFSPNAQGVSVETSPLVELLAAFGLQRFRPSKLSNDTLGYVAWREPSTPPIAMLRAAGRIPTSGRMFEFEIESRAKYKAFGPGRARSDS